MKMIHTPKDSRESPHGYGKTPGKRRARRKTRLAKTRDRQTRFPKRAYTITEHAQTEGKLRESERNYRILVENLPQKIFLKDKNSVYVSCNKNYARDLKVNPERITGKTDYDFYPKELAEKYRADDKRIMESDKMEDIEEKYIQDGREIIVHTVKTPVKDEKGKAIGVLGIFWDVTERRRMEGSLKESEERFRSLVETASDWIWEVDQNGRYTYASPRVKELLGYKPEEVLGKTPFDLMLPDEAERVAGLFKDVVKSRAPFSGLENKNLHKNGRHIVLETSGVPIIDPDGNLLGYRGIDRDITERNQVEQALRESENKYKALIETTDTGFVIIDEQGRVLDANREYVRLTGHKTLEEIMGRCVPEWTAEYQREKNLQAVNECFKRGFIRNLEIDYVGRNGGTIPIEINATVLKTAKGVVVMTLCRDITERRKRQERIRFLSLVVEQSSEGMAVADLEGNLIFVNQAWAHMHGYETSEELVGHHLRIFHTQEQAENDVVPFNQKVKEKGFHSGEVGHVRKDGVQFPTLMNTTLLRDELGKPYAIAGIAEDITERKRTEEALKESEEKYRDLFENANDLIQSVDANGEFVYVNNKWKQVMEYSDEEIEKLLLTDIIRRDQIPHCMELFKRVINGEALNEVETVFVSKNGEEFFVSGSVNPKMKDGKFVATRAIFRDITQSKRAEEEMKKRTDELLKANGELKVMQSQLLQSEKMASIGQLAAGVAHEINNPIGFINSNLGTLGEYARDIMRLLGKYKEIEKALKEKCGSETESLMRELGEIKKDIGLDFIEQDFEKVIRESQEGAERVKKIVLDLKSFAHVDDADLKQANLNQGLESTLNIVWNELKYKTVVKKEYGEIPEIECYPMQLNQVFMNMLVNAAQAIDEKGEITIKTYADDDYVYVKISDTGKGITPEHLPKIFDPFFTTKPVGAGTGLGLSTAYGIVKNHNGEIEVESKVGKGTTFTIKLPLKGVKVGAM
jgi:two-component system, NtrC family, sensor kinase